MVENEFKYSFYFYTSGYKVGSNDTRQWGPRSLSSFSTFRRENEREGTAQNDIKKNNPRHMVYIHTDNNNDYTRLLVLGHVLNDSFTLLVFIEQHVACVRNKMTIK